MSSTETESGGVGDVTYDLITIAAVNSSTDSLVDGATVMQLNFWIHAVLIKMMPCLLLTLFGCLLVSTVRESQRRAVKLRAGSRLGPHLSQASKRRLAERNRTTVRGRRAWPMHRDDVLAIINCYLCTSTEQCTPARFQTKLLLLSFGVQPVRFFGLELTVT